LSGEIVECVTRSNNDINTIFYPRADRDSISFVTNTLTFKQHDPEEPILRRVASDKSKSGKTTEFRPPMSEFNTIITELKAERRRS